MQRFARSIWPILPIVLLAARTATCGLPGRPAFTRDSSGAFFTAGPATDAIVATPGTYQPQRTPASCPNPEHIGDERCGTGFVAKYSPAGQLTWATYLGAPVDENDGPSSIALDSDGNVWVEGIATSGKFPITPDAYQPTYTPTPSGYGQFLAEISPDGTKLLYSTFLDSPYFQQLGPVQHGAVYLFGNGITKLNPAMGKIIYTALTGKLYSFQPPVIDEGDVLYVAGTTNTPDFPITSGVYSHPSQTYNAVLVALDPDGNIVFSTRIGGSGPSSLGAMVRDSDGNFYLSGAGPVDIPITSDAAHPNPGPLAPSYLPATYYPFLVKLSPDASTLLYSTFLDFAFTEMKIGADGKISGLTLGSLLLSAPPFTPDSYQPCYPSWLAYVRLSAERPSVEYSTGTPYSPDGPDGQTVFEFDPSGIVYISTSTPPVPPGSIVRPHPYFTTIDVSKAPHSGPVCMAQSVNFFQTSVTPGMLVSILGPGVGPDQPTSLVLDNSGRVSTELAGTRVLFDDIPAPILSASPSRLDVVVPFEVATSGTTTVSVLRDGQSVGTLTNPLAVSSLWLYTADGSGFGSPAWNQDGTPNSPDHPAKVGDILTFYGTGAGQMTPTPVDGTIPQSPLSALLNFSLYGDTCPVIYAGDAPGLVEGIVQINCRLIGPTTSGLGYTFVTTGLRQYADGNTYYQIYVTQ